MGKPQSRLLDEGEYLGREAVAAERVSVANYVRGEDGAWLAANLDPGERLGIECGPLRAVLTLAAIYEDTGLAVSEDSSQPR
jgi:hypothetical protein